MEGHPRFRIPEEAQAEAGGELQLSEDDAHSISKEPSGVQETRSQGSGERTEPREVVRTREESLNLEKRIQSLILPPTGLLRAAGWRLTLRLERSRIELLRKTKSLEIADHKPEVVRAKWKDYLQKILLRALKRFMLPAMRLTLTREDQMRFEQYSRLLKSRISQSGLKIPH